MNIAKHTVVTIDYTLTDQHCAILDSSKGEEPLAYIQGVGAIISGLEAALEGKAPGARSRCPSRPRLVTGSGMIRCNKSSRARCSTAPASSRLECSFERVLQTGHKP